MLKKDTWRRGDTRMELQCDEEVCVMNRPRGKYAEGNAALEKIHEIIEKEVSCQKE